MCKFKIARKQTHKSTKIKKRSMFGINQSDRKKWTSKKTKPDRRYKILRLYRSKWRRYISGGNDKRWRESLVDQCRMDSKCSKKKSDRRLRNKKRI